MTPSEEAPHLLALLHRFQGDEDALRRLLKRVRDVAVSRLQGRWPTGLSADDADSTIALTLMVRCDPDARAEDREAAQLLSLCVHGIETPRAFAVGALDVGAFALQYARLDSHHTELGRLFGATGRGKGPMRKLIDEVMAGGNSKASAREVWALCAASKQAKKRGIEFNEADAWVGGHGNVGFARFSNLVSEARRDLAGKTTKR